jgi:hypothetical protein
MAVPPITARPQNRLFMPQLRAALNYLEGAGGGGSSAWGGITGTLSSQTDLQTALNGKASANAVPAKGTASVTVPNNSREWSETVVATGVVPEDLVLISIAPHSDSDENDAELLDIAGMSAAAGTDQIVVDVSFGTPTAGVVKLNWMAT